MDKVIRIFQKDSKEYSRAAASAITELLITTIFHLNTMITSSSARLVLVLVWR